MQTDNHNQPQKLRRRAMGRYRYVRLRWRVLFSMIDMAGTVAFAVGRVAARLFLHAKLQKPEKPRPTRRILIVQLDHMGDAIITTVMLPLLRRRYPKAAIEVLCGPWNHELFQAIDDIDRVHVSHLNRFLRGDKYTIFKRFAWAGAVFMQGLRLRRWRFDLGIDVRGEFPQTLMLWLAGAGRRLGWSCGGGGFLLTDIAPFAHGRPEVESRLALLAELGITPTGEEDAVPRFKPTDAARESLAVDRELRSRKRLAWVAVHVSAGTTAKRWPVEHWRKLISLLREGGAGVVLVGGPGDRAISNRVLGTDRPDDVVDFTGRLGTVELAALLERVDLFVGGDSGPAHLAAAVATPVVALFSGTNSHHQWQPCGPNVAVLRHPVPCGPCHRERCPLAGHPCMTGIKPAEVARAASRFIHIKNNEETANDDSPAPTAANKNHARRPAITQSP